MRLNFGLRKIWRIKTSYVIALPPEWVSTNKLYPGGKVELTLAENGELIIRPAEVVQ